MTNDRPCGRNRPSHYGLPLPQICHLELSAAAVQNKAVFVIGDVHGCYDELLRLMDKAQAAENHVLFILVGDIVNRGPKSKEVVQLLRTNDNCYSVRGNHEETTLRENSKLFQDSSYDLPTRYEYVRTFDSDDIKYLHSLPYTIQIPSLHAVFVHAGLEPGLDLEQQSLTAMTHMRSLVTENGETVATNKRNVGVPWGSVWQGPDHVYYGHDENRGFHDYDFATGLDTGCVYGRELTGLFINGCRQMLKVKAKRAYHSDKTKEMLS